MYVPLCCVAWQPFNARSLYPVPSWQYAGEDVIALPCIFKTVYFMKIEVKNGCF